LEIKETYNPDETRNDLLQSAFKEIYVHGFQAASLSRILKNVNHTKGALYHHFSNKKSLGLTVIEEIIGKRMYSFFMAPLEDKIDPIPVLVQIFQTKTDTLSLEEIKYGCPLNNLTQEMSSIDEDFNKILKFITEKWITIIEEALDRGKEHNNVRTDVDSRGTALLIVASIEGAFGL
jgi:TetR/AcrR family transcriptional regulator, transcriptional repressor for nem operon